MDDHRHTPAAADADPRAQESFADAPEWLRTVAFWLVAWLMLLTLYYLVAVYVALFLGMSRADARLFPVYFAIAGVLAVWESFRSVSEVQTGVMILAGLIAWWGMTVRAAIADLRRDVQHLADLPRDVEQQRRDTQPLKRLRADVARLREQVTEVYLQLSSRISQARGPLDASGDDEEERR